MSALVAMSGQRRRVYLPTIVGFAHSKTAAPTVPAHAVGDLFVGALLRVGGTPSAVSDENWVSWQTYTGTGCCASVYTKVATTTSEAWGTWSQSGGRRLLWIFRNAQKGVIVGDALDTGEATTTLLWNTLSGMSAQSSIVCAAVLANTAQTSVAGWAPTGLSNSRVAEINTASGSDAEVVCDTGTSYLTSYSAESPLMDTSSYYANFMFSVRAA